MMMVGVNTAELERCTLNFTIIIHNVITLHVQEASTADLHITVNFR
eukprot:SAG22_NODE_594_length_8738_cov_20.249219_8_plen_46_part_00